MNDKLGLSEYTDVLYDFVGTAVLNEWYSSELDTEEEVLRKVVYTMWQTYYKSVFDISIKRDAEILQSFLLFSVKNLLKH